MQVADYRKLNGNMEQVDNKETSDWRPEDECGSMQDRRAVVQGRGWFARGGNLVMEAAKEVVRYCRVN